MVKKIFELSLIKKKGFCEPDLICSLGICVSQQATNQQITAQQITNQQTTAQQITNQQTTAQQITNQQTTDQQTTSCYIGTLNCACRFDGKKNIFFY